MPIESTLIELQQHITKLICKNCIYSQRKNIGYNVFTCTTRKDKHMKNQPLRIAPNNEACALYHEHKTLLQMNTPAKYDILELHKLTLLELEPIALNFKVDTLNKKKQDIIYAILDAQVNKETIK